MLGNTTSTTRDRLRFGGTSASRSLALLVAVALLLCHGFLGAFHLFPTDETPGSEIAAAHEAVLGEAGTAHEDLGTHSVGEEYFAVLVVLLLGLFLGPLLRRSSPWYGHAVPLPYAVPRIRRRVMHPARGPTGALLQVFRL